MTSSASPSSTPRRAQVVGTGLIGGSVAAALTEQGWHVTGRDLQHEHAERARELGVIAAVGTDPDAEITVVAVPPSALAAEVERALAETAGAVTDTGSVKSSVSSTIDHPRFVAGHPMAGSEQDGVDGADPMMFHGNVWVLTPGARTDDRVLQRVQAVLANIGADVVTMTPERHDKLVAVVSHVPHLTAATLMALADDRALDDKPLLRLAAGGFRDMTRIAAGHPGIWIDIASENRQAIVEVLDEFGERLADMRRIVDAGDTDGLREILTQARAARNNLPSRGVRPQDLIEVRIPMPDRPGEVAAISMIAANTNVNIMDIEIAHSPEGVAGVLVILVARAEVESYLHALEAEGYHPTTRELA